MKVLGLDLSLTASGCVVLNDGKLHKKLLIKTKPDTSKTHLNELKRLIVITQKIEDLLSDEEISIATIEGLSFGTRNSTALIQLSGLNYFVRKLLFDYNIPFVICVPTTLKKFITGHGNSGKDVLMLETYKRYGVTLTSDDLCDAYGLARISEALISDVKLTVFQKEVVELLKKQL